MTNVIILNVYFKDENEEKKLREINALCEAVDCNIVYTLSKLVLRPNPATIIGKGKLEELAAIVEDTNTETVIYNGELSPSQTLNIADIVGCAVITKTNLILDIFARRATSNEGKVLVELAQLKYLYPRLKGKGDSLSRQGGGIGTVGPGETKLETDRRYIRGRILALERSLKEIAKRRKLQQSRRTKNQIKTVAIVGYTNVGKSTLLNKLCKSNVTELDRVFATLDPTARATEINGKNVIFVDTVGFIEELPESLVEAFKSTLEIAKTADMLLLVSDVNDEFIYQREVAEKLLNEMDAQKERIYVLNKCDLESSAFIPDEYVRISAKKDIGINELKDIIFERLFGQFRKYSITLDYEKTPLIKDIQKIALTAEAEYGKESVKVSGKILVSDYEKLIRIISDR